MKRGLLKRELKATESNKMKIDPLDIEIIPPDKPGEKGLTERDIRALEMNNKQNDSLDSY